MLQKGSNLRKNMYYGFYPMMASSLAYRVEIKAITRNVRGRRGAQRGQMQKYCNILL
jgi:hypothetical protein